MKTETKQILKGHLLMAFACACWGLMAPLGKDAMNHGIPGLQMVAFRVCGAAMAFWVTSFVMKWGGHKEEGIMTQGATAGKARFSMLKGFFLASLFAIVFNQCNYTIGLSITSPLNASIMTTIMPIVTMVLAAIFLKEPITRMKVGGVLLGAGGAATLILASASGSYGGGALLGDLLCVAAQCSYAIYLTAYKNVIQRYSVITSMKWMMLFASLLILPIALPGMLDLPWSTLSLKTILEASFVVFGGTFIAYIFCTAAQKILRPTVVAMYNYVQPIVSCIFSVIMGIGIFGLSQAFAVVLVFSGVWLVNKSKGRR